MSVSAEPSSTEHQDRTVFEVTLATLTTALFRILRASSVGTKLTQLFFIFRKNAPTLADCSCTLLVDSGLYVGHHDIEIECVEIANLERQRQVLLSAVAAFDSFVADLLRFVLLREPSMRPVKPVLIPGESQDSYVERIVTKTSLSRWRERHNFLVEKFSIGIDPEIVDKLEKIVEARHVLMHQGASLYKLYRDVSRNEVAAEAKMVPEVSFEESMEAIFVVTEVCDAYALAICRQFYKDEPRVRPLTPEVRLVHQSLREEWAARRSKPVEIERFEDVGWHVRELQGRWCVCDRMNHWFACPIEMGGYVLMLSFTRNTLHGARARVAIEQDPFVELKMCQGGDFLERLVAGQYLQIEFYEEARAEASHACYSLFGFSEAWAEACGKQVAKDQ